MSDTETISGMRRIFDEALALAERKNNDYGDAWKENGWRGNIARIFEKTRRLRNLLWNGNPGAGQLDRETTRETAIDMMNTLAFFIMNQDRGVEWGHEDPFEWGRSTPTLPPVSQPSAPASGSPEATRYTVPAGELNDATDTQRSMSAVGVPGNDDGPFEESAAGLPRRPRPGKRPIKDAPQA